MAANTSLLKSPSRATTPDTGFSHRRFLSTNPGSERYAWLRQLMASEVQGLSDLRAYLKSGNMVVPLSFPYIERPKRHEALIDRKLQAEPLRPDRAQTTKAAGNGDGRVQASSLPPPIPPRRQQHVKTPVARAANDDLPFLE